MGRRLRGSGVGLSESSVTDGVFQVKYGNLD